MKSVIISELAEKYGVFVKRVKLHNKVCYLPYKEVGAYTDYVCEPLGKVYNSPLQILLDIETKQIEI